MPRESRSSTGNPPPVGAPTSHSSRETEADSASILHTLYLLASRVILSPRTLEPEGSFETALFSEYPCSFRWPWCKCGRHFTYRLPAVFRGCGNRPATGGHHHVARNERATTVGLTFGRCEGQQRGGLRHGRVGAAVHHHQGLGPPAQRTASTSHPNCRARSPVNTSTNSRRRAEATCTTRATQGTQHSHEKISAVSDATSPPSNRPYSKQAWTPDQGAPPAACGSGNGAAPPSRQRRLDPAPTAHPARSAPTPR